MVKLLIFPLLMYKFSTSPVKILRGPVFGGIDKLLDRDPKVVYTAKNKICGTYPPIHKIFECVVELIKKIL